MQDKIVISIKNIYIEYMILFLGTFYDVGATFGKNNWAGTFYSLIYTDVQMK